MAKSKLTKHREALRGAKPKKRTAKRNPPSPRYYVMERTPFGDMSRTLSTEHADLDSAVELAESLLEENAGLLLGVYEAPWDEDDRYPIEPALWEGSSRIEPIKADSPEALEVMSYWVSPYGEIYPVPTYGHASVAARLIMQGEFPGGDHLADEAALRAGWLQVSVEPGSAPTFNYFNAEPAQRQLDAVFDLAVAHNTVEASYTHPLWAQEAMRWLSEPSITRNPVSSGDKIERSSWYGVLKKYYGDEIKKLRYVGSMKAHDCDKNSYRNREDFDVYVGHILFYDPAYARHTIASHVFNVDRGTGRVVEFTELYDGKKDFEGMAYFGKPYEGLLKEISLDTHNVALKQLALESTYESYVRDDDQDVPLDPEVSLKKELPKELPPREKWAYDTGMSWSSDPRRERELVEIAKGVIGRKKPMIEAFTRGLREGRGEKPNPPRGTLESYQDFHDLLFPGDPVVTEQENPYDTSDELLAEIASCTGIDQRWLDRAMNEVLEGVSGLRCLWFLHGAHGVDKVKGGKVAAPPWAKRLVIYVTKYLLPNDADEQQRGIAYVDVVKTDYAKGTFTVKKYYDARDPVGQTLRYGRFIEVYAKHADLDPKELTHELKWRPKRAEFEWYVSCHPYNILTMSAGRVWKSCTSPGGLFEFGPLTDMAAGAAILWFKYPGATEPCGRVVLRPYLDEGVDGALIPDIATGGVVYGAGIGADPATLNRLLRPYLSAGRRERGLDPGEVTGVRRVDICPAGQDGRALTKGIYSDTDRLRRGCKQTSAQYRKAYKNLAESNWPEPEEYTPELAEIDELSRAAREFVDDDSIHEYDEQEASNRELEKVVEIRVSAGLMSAWLSNRDVDLETLIKVRVSRGISAHWTNAIANEYIEEVAQEINCPLAPGQAGIDVISRSVLSKLDSEIYTTSGGLLEGRNVKTLVVFAYAADNLDTVRGLVSSLLTCADGSVSPAVPLARLSHIDLVDKKVLEHAGIVQDGSGDWHPARGFHGRDPETKVEYTLIISNALLNNEWEKKRRGIVEKLISLSAVRDHGGIHYQNLSPMLGFHSFMFDVGLA